MLRFFLDIKWKKTLKYKENRKLGSRIARKFDVKENCFVTGGVAPYTYGRAK